MSLFLLLRLHRGFFNNLCYYVSNLHKDGDINPEAAEKWQSVCIQNFASSTDPNLKF